MVEFDHGRRLMSRVDELKILLIKIKNIFMKNDVFPVCSNDCEHYLINPQKCETLKFVIQRLMNQGIFVVDRSSTHEDVSILEISYDEVLPLQIPYGLSQITISNNPVTLMVITVPTSFPLMIQEKFHGCTT